MEIPKETRKNTSMPAGMNMVTLRIGNVTLENNLILAPMAGVTDLPFRVLCKEQGVGLKIGRAHV